MTPWLRPYLFDADLGVLGMLRSRKAGVLGVALASAAVLFLAALPSLTAHRAVLPNRCRKGHISYNSCFLFMPYGSRLQVPTLVIKMTVTTASSTQAFRPQHNQQATLSQPLASHQCTTLMNAEAAGCAHAHVSGSPFTRRAPTGTSSMDQPT